MVLLASAVLSVSTSCSNEIDEIFGESAAERLNHTQAKYSKLLTSSKNGWAFEYYPTASASDGCVLYAVKFSEDGSVDVAGDPFGSGTISSDISAWDIIADQGPVLSFSTYNDLIHIFSDPKDDGLGYEGDYEFAIVYSETENPDSVVMLKGKKRGLYSRLKMIDEEVTPEQYLAGCQAKMSELFPSTMRNYVLLHIGNDIVRMDDMKTGVPDTYIYGKDKVLFGVPNSYIFVKYSGNYYARFNDPFKASDSEITEKNFVYNETSQQFIGVDNPDVTITAPHFATFITDETLANAVKWRLSKNSEMSGQFKTAWDAAYSALLKKGNTLNECVLSTTNAGEGNNLTLSFKYKPRTGAAREVFFNFNIARDGDVVTLQYVGPYNPGAETVLSGFPECKALIDAVAGSYTVDNPNAVQLVINSLRLTSEDGTMFSMFANYAAETTQDK